MKAVAAAVALVLLLAQGVVAPSARAQSPAAGILDGVDVVPAGQGWRVVVRFSAPVRYLHHAPEALGDTILVQLDQGTTTLEASPEPLRQSANVSGGLPVPLTAVVYERGLGRSASLEIRFARPMRFELSPGKDFRSIELLLPESGPSQQPGQPLRPPPRPQSRAAPRPSAENEVRSRTGPIPVDLSHPYAIELSASPQGEPPNRLPELGVFRHYRVYTATSQHGGKTWTHLRLGFFAGRASAETFLPELLPHFSSARVVRTGLRERAASAHSFVPPTDPDGDDVEPLPRSSAETTLAPASDEMLQLLADGRAAMTRGDHVTAIRLFTKALTLPPSDGSPEAKELLGLARERNHQIAHAKAEYEEYLALYPEGEGSERVQQRLATLLTIHATPKPRDRPRTTERGRRVAFDLFGSLSTGYRHAARITDDEGSQTIDSVAFSDFDVNARTISERYTIRSRMNGRYGYDLLDRGTSSESRVSTLFLDLDDRDWDVGTTLGRQSRSTGGILGRFDGALLRYRFRPNWELASVAGFPVDSQSSRRLQTERQIVGMSLERERISQALDAQLYGIHQLVDGRTDRSAVGAEIRYAKNGRFVGSFLDYDVYYGSLNIASLVANLRLTTALNVNCLIDYRNTPILTTTSALQGQTAESLEELREIFSDDEIEKLAEDRTGRSTMMTLGASYRLSDRFQLTGDLSASKLSGTSTSGGVEGIEGTGIELGYLTQLIANDLVMKGDLAILGVRYFDGDLADTYSVSLLARYPITRRFRLSPILRADYRTSAERRDVLTLRPTLRINYRWSRFTIDLEAGGEWRESDIAGVATEELGYNVWVNLRYDF